MATDLERGGRGGPRGPSLSLQGPSAFCQLISSDPPEVLKTDLKYHAT